MPDDPKTIPHCPTCGQQMPSEAALSYRDAHWRAAILRATPPEVWAQYAADGIDLPQAITMEMSYGG